MRKAKEQVTRYRDGFFRIDIINYGNGFYEAMLSHTDYGVSDLMFGMNADSEEYFLELVEANLEEYEEGYLEEYCNE